MDASRSGGDGAVIDNRAGAKNVTVMNSVFNNNGDIGLKVLSNGWILVEFVTANDNGDTGAYLETSSEKIIVRHSEFNDTDACEWICTDWFWWWCINGYWNCDETNDSQNIGLHVNNLNEVSHETTICDVTARYNDLEQIRLVSPEGTEESNFVYNLCDLDTKADGCGKCGCGGGGDEIFIYGGKNWEEHTGEYVDTCPNGGSPGTHYGSYGCWSWWIWWWWKGDVVPEEIVLDKTNLNVNYKNVDGDVWTENDVDFNHYGCGEYCPDCGEGYCGDGFLQPGEQCDPGNGEDIPPTHPGCSEECTFDYDGIDLDLDPYCVDVEGEWRMQWEVNNPNAFQVDVNWATSDGQMGSATLDPGVNEITTTELGTWTMNVDWPGGTDSLTHTINDCEPGNGDGGGGGPLLAGVIDLIIPVTGEQLSVLPFAGSLIVGLGFLVKGLYGKIKK